jgi:hypothetical protein
MTKLTLSMDAGAAPVDAPDDALPQDEYFSDEVGAIAVVLWTALCSAQAGGTKVTRNGVAVACADLMLKITAAHAKYTGQEDRLIAYLDL